MKKRNYIAPALKEQTQEQFRLHCERWRRWKREHKGHYYMTPMIQVFSSWEAKNAAVVQQIANQQEKDENQAFVLTLLSTALFNLKGQAAEVSYNNGLVETILSYEVGRFITACLNGERECTFNSLYNWAIQFGRGNGITEWRQNCSKACRRIWKQLPKSLKMGAKEEFVRHLYSTAMSAEDKKDVCKSLLKNIEQKIAFYGKFNGLWAKELRKKAFEEKASMMGYTEAAIEYFGWK